MIKNYVIMERGYEYNDEIMYIPECGGGMSEKVFNNKGEAESECLRLNIKELSTRKWGHYCYSLRDMFKNPDEAIEILKTDDAYSVNFNNLTQEEKKQIIGWMRDPPFYIVEID